MHNAGGLRKGAWTEEEDVLLRKCIEKYGEGKWHLVPFRAGLNRCRKSCRLRWLNYLRPDIKRGNFELDEVGLIIRLHKLLGNRWSLIAGRIPGRTANDVKNYWNTHLQKKMAAKRELPEKDEPEKTANDHIPTEIVKPRPRTFSKNASKLLREKLTTSTSAETAAKADTTQIISDSSQNPQRPMEKDYKDIQSWWNNLEEDNNVITGQSLWPQDLSQLGFLEEDDNCMLGDDTGFFSTDHDADFWDLLIPDHPALQV